MTHYLRPLSYGALAASLPLILPVSYAADDIDLEADLHSLMAESTVTIASRTAESIIQAPAKVSVYTREDIRNLGVQNLFDLLEHSLAHTNLTKFHTLVAKNNGLSTGSFVIYRDGIRLRTPTTSNYAPNPPHIDLGNVERVEIMHGPGSVLYGQGAAAGVVHMISRRNQNYAEVGIGSYGRKRLVANLHGAQESSGLAANLSIASQSDDGADFENLTSLYGFAEPIALDRPGTDINKGPHAIDLQMDYKQFSLNTGYRTSRGEGGINGPAFGLSLDNYSDQSEQWLRLQYDLPDTHTWQGKLALTHNRYRKQLRDFGYPGALINTDLQFVGYQYQRDIKENQLEVHLQRKLNDKHDFQVGLEYTTMKLAESKIDYLGDALNPQITPDPFGVLIPLGVLPEGLETSQSHIYLQHKGQWTPKLSTTIGTRAMRYELEDDDNNEFSHRIALNYQVSPKHSIKLINNQAFDTLDLAYAINNEIDFSTIRSNELVYEFNNPKLNFSVGLDRKRYFQVVTSFDSSGRFRIGSEEFKTTLAKLDTTIRLNKHWKASANFSKHLSSDSEADFISYLEYYQPEYIAAAAMTYQKAPWAVNVSVTSRGQYDADRSREGDVPAKTEYHANLRYQFSPKTTLVATGRNLTDQITGLGENIGVTQSLYYPSSRGRELYLGLEHKW